MTESVVRYRGKRVALLKRGDSPLRAETVSTTEPLFPLAQLLSPHGVETHSVTFNDETDHELRNLLLTYDAVLVWVNPLNEGHSRDILNKVLLQVANGEVFVSAHPDIIRKLGTKEVLHLTRGMSWGSDTRLYRTHEELCAHFSNRLQLREPRVLKQCRGNGGDGVWKVELQPDNPSHLLIRHALRGSAELSLPIEDFLDQCRPYFLANEPMIDQPFQPRLADGMIRCYLVQGEVVGFGHQAVNALFPAPVGDTVGEAQQPGPRLYYSADAPAFQNIKAKMMHEWLDALCLILNIGVDELPLIWDADFMFGPKTLSGEDTYVLCEINVSCVYPFPDAAFEPLSRAVMGKLEQRGTAKMRMNG